MSDTTIQLAVNGTLMRGLKLNQNLLNAGATFLREAKTKRCYRLFSINDEYPAMIKSDNGGEEIAIEIWSISSEGLVIVLQNEPPGLAIGKIETNDGEEILGVLGEGMICKDDNEITKYKGWKEYIKNTKENE